MNHEHAFLLYKYKIQSALSIGEGHIQEGHGIQILASTKGYICIYAYKRCMSFGPGRKMDRISYQILGSVAGMQTSM